MTRQVPGTQHVTLRAGLGGLGLGRLDGEATQLLAQVGAVDLGHRVGVALAVRGPQEPPDHLGVPLLFGDLEELRPDCSQAEVQETSEIGAPVQRAARY